MIIDPNDKDRDRKITAEFALYEVIDPELMINIVDLGLVYDITFPEENHVEVLMTLTTPSCPMGDAIQTGVINALEKTFPDYTVGITRTFDPAWDYSMVSHEGLRQLQDR
jgi:metal-sulfur cluster biosynthetic enzyme